MTDVEYFIEKFAEVLPNPLRQYYLESMNKKYPKYYHRNNTTIPTKWKEVPMDKDHMWFIQLNGTIECAFSKYGIKSPVSVWIDDHDTFSNIYVVRNEIENEVQATGWFIKRISIHEELDFAAQANSDDFVTYKFFLV